MLVHRGIFLRVDKICTRWNMKHGYALPVLWLARIKWRLTHINNPPLLKDWYVKIFLLQYLADILSLVNHRQTCLSIGRSCLRTSPRHQCFLSVLLQLPLSTSHLRHRFFVPAIKFTESSISRLPNRPILKLQEIIANAKLMMIHRWRCCRHRCSSFLTLDQLLPQSSQSLPWFPATLNPHASDTTRTDTNGTIYILNYQFQFSLPRITNYEIMHWNLKKKNY